MIQFMQRTRLFSDDDDEDLFIEERNIKQLKNLYIRLKIFLSLIMCCLITFLVYLVFL